MDKLSIFKDEINYVKDSKLKEDFKTLINLLPDYFFEVPASSTGKYHPEFAAGSGGMVVAVGYAMVINMMASKEVWPFFAIGFALAAIKDLTLIALGAIGLSMALMYLALEAKGGNGSGSNNSGDAGTGDPLGDIIDDY